MGQVKPEAQAQAAQLLRITLPAVVCLSLSGVLSALLYALKRFTLPAFTAAIFNASMVGLALLLGRWWGVSAMAWGLLLGAILQIVLQLPGLRDGLPALRPVLTLSHPGLRQIFHVGAGGHHHRGRLDAGHRGDLDGDRH